MRASIQGSSTSSTRRRTAHLRCWLAAFAATVLLATLATGTATAATEASTATDDPTVITDWNEIAVTTLLGDTTKQLVEDFLYLGFVQAAVYDAVVGVEGRYAPTASTPTRPMAPPPRRPRSRPPTRSW
jgi:heme A synthase